MKIDEKIIIVILFEDLIDFCRSDSYFRSSFVKYLSVLKRILALKITSFDFSTKEWYKATTIGGPIPSGDLNRYATKLKDKIYFIVFKPNYTGDSTQVFSFDLNKLKWSVLGTLNLKIRFSDFFDKTGPSPFLVMNRFFYYLDYENNKVSKYLLPQNSQIKHILETCPSFDNFSIYSFENKFDETSIITEL